MPTLLFDIRAAIVEWVYRLSQGDHQTLAASSLVCRSWTPIAQWLLYRRIPAIIVSGLHHDDIALPLLVRALRHNPVLGSYVRSIFVDHAFGQSRDRVPHDIDPVTLLGLCPHIEAIHIQGSLESFAWWADAARRLIPLGLQPTVLSLSFERAAVAAQLLSIWPSIRYFSAAIRYRTDDPPLPLSATLYGVEFRTPVQQRREYVAWMLSFDRGYSVLHSLDFPGHWMEYFIPVQIAWNIRSLKLWDVPPDRVLETLTSLDELIISMPPRAPPSFPPALKHLGFHEPDYLHTETKALGPLVEALSACASLQLVTVTRFSSREVLDRLRGTCRLLNIEFVIFPEPNSYPVSRLFRLLAP